MSAPPLFFESIAALGRSIRAGDTTPLELTETLLERIDSLDARLGAFRIVCHERALAEARAATIALEAGQDLGPLHGMPYAAKDLFDVGGLPTSAGCRLLEDAIATRDGAVIRRLARAGMVLLGKTVTVQFAYGGAGVNHHHGTPHNPWHETPHLPGGSSSGSGVAVAAGLAPVALGTDTGGSVRIPASLCGITGLKTTVGQVSRAGVYPLSWTLDSVGPLARTVEDAALVYEAMRGPDPDDDSTLGRLPGEPLRGIERGVRGLRVGVAETVFFDGAEPEVAAAVRAAAEVLAGLGAHVESVAFDEAQMALDLNPRGLIIAAEAYTLNRRLLEEHADELDPVVALRMAHGGKIPAHEYLATMRERARLCRRVVERLADVDALLCPTTMWAATPVADADADFESYSRHNLACLRNTAIGNILGLCGLSVPCGFTAKGLPIGLMIYAKPFDEETALRVGHAYQGATDWHARRPDVGWALARAR